MTDYSTLDEALDVLAPYGGDLRSGLTNHAPMAVEAMAAMGRADAVLPWLEGYRREILPLEPAREPIGADWRAALGRTDRVGDWNAYFEAALAEAPWPDVVARWGARLAPAFCASATHGVLRTGHAVRGLAERETPARRRELARGLAYWAASWQTLPTGTAAGPATTAREAISRVPRVPPAERRFSGTIVSSLEALANFPAFAPVAGMLDVERDPAAVVSDVTETFARVYLANAHDFLTAIVFVHGITSVAALRSLLPHLPAPAAREATRWAWQSSASLYATFGSAAPGPDEIEPPRESADELFDRALHNGDDHAIKVTEACLREHAQNPAPAYLTAARHAIGILVH